MAPHILSEEFLSLANPFLLDAEIGAAVLLGVGIIFESDRYCEAVKCTALKMVVCGVVLETIFSIALFQSENWIGDSQRTTIISLTRRLAPRGLTVEDRQKIVSGILPFAGTRVSVVVPDIAPWPDITALAVSIRDTIADAHWNIEPMGGSAFEGYGIRIDTALSTECRAPADALFKALDAVKLSPQLHPLSLPKSGPCPEIYVLIGLPAP